MAKKRPLAPIPWRQPFRRISHALTARIKSRVSADLRAAALAQISTDRLCDPFQMIWWQIEILAAADFQAAADILNSVVRRLRSEEEQQKPQGVFWGAVQVASLQAAGEHTVRAIELLPSGTATLSGQEVTLYRVETPEEAIKRLWSLMNPANDQHMLGKTLLSQAAKAHGFNLSVTKNTNASR